MKLSERIGSIAKTIEIPVLVITTFADLAGGLIAYYDQIKFDEVASIFAIFGLIILNALTVFVGLEAIKRDEAEKKRRMDW